MPARKQECLPHIQIEAHANFHDARSSESRRGRHECPRHGVNPQNTEACMKLNLLLLLCCATAGAQTITGIHDDQVLQRDERGVAEIRLSGDAPAAARAVEARLLREFLPLDGLDWSRLVEPRAGK